MKCRYEPAAHIPESPLRPFGSLEPSPAPVLSVRRGQASWPAADVRALVGGRRACVE